MHRASLSLFEGIPQAFDSALVCDFGSLFRSLADLVADGVDALLESLDLFLEFLRAVAQLLSCQRESVTQFASNVGHLFAGVVVGPLCREVVLANVDEQLP